MQSLSKIKSPARLKERENEPENVNPLGKPPNSLNRAERAAWRRIVKESIPGVLGEADRMAVELAARLHVKIQGGTAMAVELTQYVKLLGQFGMTPSERSRVSIEKPKKKNPFDDV